jgi:peptidoglycan/xylan/chitin deacetylase (PgdA/CDA1 family)
MTANQSPASQSAVTDLAVFAETSIDAWARPAGLGAAMRKFTKQSILSLANRLTPVPQGPFIRCLYAHAVFQDNAANFRKAIRQVKSAGDFIDTPTLLEIIRSGREPDGRYFHLSFDDGFANVYEVGGEVLADEGVPYTMFVIANMVDASPEELSGYFSHMPVYRRMVRPMSWAQVKAAATTPGCEIGCHTMSHPRLSEISSDPARLQNEIAGAKALIEQKTGVPCNSFAWPYGRSTDIDEASLEAIEAAGFTACFSAVRGRVDPGKVNVLQIPRHHFEAHWPAHEVTLWAKGFREA